MSAWLPLVLVLLLALGYGYGLYRLRDRKRSDGWRAASFLLGLVLVGTALLPEVARWAHHDLRGHMVQHLLIGMFAPLFLVLGQPVTLALRALPVRLARRVTAVFRYRGVALLTHPVTALLLNIGGMYLLYLTPLYAFVVHAPHLHHLLHFHFLAAGYLFTWSVIGEDPVPRRPRLRLRVIVLFLSVALHATLSKVMYAYLYPRGGIHSAEEIRAAAKLMYYWGDLSELLLIIAVFALWYRKRGRPHYDLSPLLP
ncbi:putative membrane protein [Lewinella marina]|uniref:Cytochrome c oxidase assembly protein n=1 Tax=Neolewinella marina TaxID=438751 RepID=A0A2G0CKG6_9BACT|nr:cytochrome c oxidase assembly protein [Neolewinella marina]NJB84349.1 putative membrane protein [Neolewinella marina]PHL00452.1 hypothetical protein CGL56_05315 [Neolewinella marina]